MRYELRRPNKTISRPVASVRSAYGIRQTMNLTKECDFMKKQLQGIAIILVSILLMLGFGNAPFFDLSFRWSLIFAIIGIAGAAMTFLPDKK